MKKKTGIQRLTGMIKTTPFSRGAWIKPFLSDVSPL